MRYISDSLILGYLRLREEFKLDDFIDTKRFTISDTPLSYRQANSLEADDLLTKDRENKNGWRKFSFRELVYVELVYQLKKFGLQHQQLRKLWDAFFKEPIKIDPKMPRPQFNKIIGETAIGCVFGQVEITLCVDSAGEIAFYDPTNYALFYDSSKPQIEIRLNEIVNGLLPKVGKKPFPVTQSIQQAILDHGFSLKERELMEIVRNEDYTSISVKKKDGEIAMVYAEKIKKKSNEITNQELLKLIDEKAFQNVSIVKRDGQIVNCVIEESIKL
jgi:DNA-binding transcriptional MerR regulator